MCTMWPFVVSHWLATPALCVQTEGTKEAKTRSLLLSHTNTGNQRAPGSAESADPNPHQRPFLGYPDFDQPFALHCDASQNGLGAVLY